MTIKTIGVPSPYSVDVSLHDHEGNHYGDHDIGHASDTSPVTTWINAGSSTGTISVDKQVSDGVGIRFVFTSWSDGSTANPRPSTVMNGPKTFTANYKTQYKITFSQSGIGSDFSGTVFRIDGTNYARSSLPVSIWWDKGSTHTFQFLSPLTGRNSRYLWKTTTGLSTLQSGTIIASMPGTITGNYGKTSQK